MYCITENVVLCYQIRKYCCSINPQQIIKIWTTASMAVLARQSHPLHWHQWAWSDIASTWESWGDLRKFYQPLHPPPPKKKKSQKIKPFVNLFFFPFYYTALVVWMPALMRKRVQDCANDSKDGRESSKQPRFRLSWNNIS